MKLSIQFSHSINFIFLFSLSLLLLFYYVGDILGPSGKAVRQYFPYVSSESDLQRYKAVTLHKQPSNDTRASSSLSNMPSDSTKTKVRAHLDVIVLVCIWLYSTKKKKKKKKY
jgi:hypothetical protein